MVFGQTLTMLSSRAADAAYGYPLKAEQFDLGSAVVPAGLRASAPVTSRQDASASG